jgi:hypothetical protein
MEIQHMGAVIGVDLQHWGYCSYALALWEVSFCTYTRVPRQSIEAHSIYFLFYQELLSAFRQYFVISALNIGFVEVILIWKKRERAGLPKTSQIM